jgi:hypothetical protein
MLTAVELLREYAVIVDGNTAVMNLNEADAVRLGGTPVEPEPTQPAEPVQPAVPAEPVEQAVPAEREPGRPEPAAPQDKGRRAPNKARTSGPDEYLTVDR